MALRYLYLLFVLILLGSCTKHSAPDFHHDYFGLEEGRFVIYDVVEITHDKQVGVHDTLHYQLKTKWGEEFDDNSGRRGRKLLRFVRNTPADEWEPINTWHGLITQKRAEMVEENQRKVKLVFAPTHGKTWDLNASISEKEIQCYYDQIHTDTIMNGIYFDSILRVSADITPSLIEDYEMSETYANGIGLIQKHFKANNYYSFNTTEVDKGKELYYNFVATGFE